MFEIGQINAWIIGGVIIALSGLVFYARTRPGWILVLLRSAAVLLILMLVIQPVRIYRDIATGKPVLAVLVDHSTSMGVKDPEERLEKVKDVLRERMTGWVKKADVRTYLFARNTSLATNETLDTWKASGDSTHIGHALEEIARELSHELSAVLLLSDGRDNGLRDPLAVAREMDVPVYTVGVGSASQMKDMLIADVRASDFAFKNTPVDITILVRGYGFAGKEIPVRLYKDGEIVSSRKAAILSDGTDSLVSFRLTPKQVGTSVYQVRIPLYPGEASTQNNRAEFSIDVIREKLRILYICGQPGYEYAFLREALKSDPAVELVSFVILRNPENVAFVQDKELSLIPFPAREIFLEKLFSFDLLIFENFTYRRFGIITPYLENIRTFVQDKGGAFIMIGGPNSFGMGTYANTPINDILPVYINNKGEQFDLTPFQLRPRTIQHPVMQISDSAQKNSAAWASLPSLVGYNRFGAAKPGAVVLGEHPRALVDKKPVPVITVWEKDKGRVMALSSNTTWRWAMGLSAQGKTAFGYTRFWRQAVRWLTQADDMKLVLVTIDKKQFEPGSVMRVKVMVKNEAYDPLSDAHVYLHVTGPDGLKRNLRVYPGKAGEFYAEYEAWDIGTYLFEARARYPGTAHEIGRDKRKVNVRSFSRESIELNLNEQLLRGIASQSGGKYDKLELFDAKDLFRSMKIRHRGEITTKKLLWNHPLVFTLILLFLIAEWYIRRRRGLP